MNKRIYYFGSIVIIAGLLFSGVVSSCGGSPSSGLTPTPGPASTHTLKGYENCFSCHSTGAGGAPKYPANHSGRTNDQCATCHKII
jgi:hypothetical protein